MEACNSTNYWARQFEYFGHVLKLIKLQYVKPYVWHHTNDKNDMARQF
jgi:transposase